MIDKSPQDSEELVAETGKEAYESPKVESVQLSQEAAEALT